MIGGEWRGRPLRAPRGTRTRPSAARLREALFSAALPWIAGARVLDLFSGSGALGIEALSRGAEFVEFVDLDPRALRAIGQNLQTLGADPARYRIRRGDAWRLVDQLARGPVDAAVVLADPPYSDDLPGRCLPAAARAVESGWLRLFVLEHPASAVDPGLELADHVRLRRREHGGGAFTLLHGSDA